MFEEIGTCELVSEILKISEELTKRSTEKFDGVDVWRLIQTAESTLIVLSKIQISKLSPEEKRLLCTE